MPLPLILGVGAAVAGIAGVGSGIHGGIKMKDAKDTMEVADFRHKKNIARFEEQSERTNAEMDRLGKEELRILTSFDNFIRVFEKIHNKPEFKEVTRDGVDLPKYNADELKRVSVGAGVLLGGLGGAAVGTAGGFAAAGATTAAVMALGTASTGTAISTLSGVAATNAALAALGGGSLTAGGGGMALGSAILGGTTLGVGLLVGGVIFNITGSSLSDKADEAWRQMMKAEEEIDSICAYLESLHDVAKKYCASLLKVDKVYDDHLEKLKYIVEGKGKTDWRMFTDEEKLITENLVLLVSVLFNMCKVELVLVNDEEDEINKVNINEAEKSIKDANKALELVA